MSRSYNYFVSNLCHGKITCGVCLASIVGRTLCVAGGEITRPLRLPKRTQLVPVLRNPVPNSSGRAKRKFSDGIYVSKPYSGTFTIKPKRGDSSFQKTITKDIHTSVCLLTIEYLAKLQYIEFVHIAYHPSTAYFGTCLFLLGYQYLVLHFRM